MDRITFRLIRASVVIVVDAMLIEALILLLDLDTMVHNMLYDYGLVFSRAWAEPYWLIMRTSMALIVVAIVVLSILEFVYPLFVKKPQPVEAEIVSEQKKPKAK